MWVSLWCCVEEDSEAWVGGRVLSEWLSHLSGSQEWRTAETLLHVCCPHTRLFYVHFTGLRPSVCSVKWITDKWGLWSFFFFSIVFLRNLYIQRRAWTSEPEIECPAVPTEPAIHPRSLWWGPGVLYFVLPLRVYTVSVLIIMMDSFQQPGPSVFHHSDFFILYFVILILYPILVHP